MWHVSYVAFIVSSSPVAGYPSPFLLPPPRLMLPDRRPPPALRSMGLCRVDGSAWFFFHAGQLPPSEPAWSLHCHQPPRQTGELCPHTLDLIFCEDIMRFLTPFDWCIIEGFFLVVDLSRWMSFLPRNGSRCPSLHKTTPCMAVRWTGLIPLAFTPAPAALESPATHPPSLELTPLLVSPLMCAFLFVKGALNVLCDTVT